jgi:uncharacterized membrane protein
MPDAYEWTKVAHVVVAVLVGGTSASSGIWLELFVLRGDQPRLVLTGLRFMLAAVVLPGLAVQAALGLMLVRLGHWDGGARWLLAGEALWLAIVAGAAMSLVLVVKMQRALDATPPDEIRFHRWGRTAEVWGAFTGIAFLAVLAVMVTKPG